MLAVASSQIKYFLTWWYFILWAWTFIIHSSITTLITVEIHWWVLSILYLTYHNDNSPGEGGGWKGSRFCCGGVRSKDQRYFHIKNDLLTVFLTFCHIIQNLISHPKKEESKENNSWAIDILHLFEMQLQGTGVRKFESSWQLTKFAFCFEYIFWSF